VRARANMRTGGNTAASCASLTGNGRSRLSECVAWAMTSPKVEFLPVTVASCRNERDYADLL
jgi:hypothetical protein